MSDLRYLLEVWGADTKTVLHSVMNDEAFYLKMLREFAENSKIDLLNHALEKENYKEAFALAHEIKGSAITLGLKPLYTSVSRVVEDLRGVPMPVVYDDIEAVNLEFESFIEIMRSYMI